MAQRNKPGDEAAADLQAAHLRLLRCTLDVAQACTDPPGRAQARCLALATMLGELRALGAPAFVLEAWGILLADAEWTRAELEAEAARLAEKAAGADAVRQLAAAEADGGPSALSVGDLLAQMEAWAREHGGAVMDERAPGEPKAWQGGGKP